VLVVKAQKVLKVELDLV